MEEEELTMLSNSKTIQLSIDLNYRLTGIFQLKQSFLTANTANFTLCKILNNIDRQAIFLRFKRLIKMSGRINQMLLRVRCNSFRCKIPYKGAILKATQNKCIQKFKYCVIITKSFVKFANKTSFLGNRRGKIKNVLFKS